MSDVMGAPAQDALAHLPVTTFVAGWRALVGEPPAVMLENRSEMIRLLVESSPADPAQIDEQFRVLIEGWLSKG
ncbi:hypothetical protein [Methylorubrum podarium]|jgi:hypothetical protein|uniref:hypothetical protein n=1 Tax=Methylorubrum podarium TaxID=200476 RepID=UPI001EE2D491|nr:hypothetical protein [Methylorubrum podarium]GJE69881.1 hypothetical protein CHKEEEPN_1412 [Methylorubrum podarium]